MIKRICAAVMCVVMAASAFCNISVTAQMISGISIVQTGRRSVAVSGSAEAFADITLLLAPEEGGRADYFYLRQTSADAGGNFSFRVKLRETDPDTFRVHLSGKGLDINSETVYTLSEDFVADDKETVNRSSEIEVDYLLIANVIYISGYISEGSKKSEIAVSVVGTGGDLFAAGQQSPVEGKFERALALNPEFYDGAETGYLRVGGANINIRRFEIPLYSGDRLESMRAAMERVKSEQELIAAIDAYGEITGLEKYKGYAGELYKAFSENAGGGFSSMRKYADCVKNTRTALDRISACLSEVNSAAASDKWSIIRTAVTETYADLIGTGVSNENGINDKKELYMRMCGKAYKSISEISEAFAAAVTAQKNAEAGSKGASSAGSSSGGIYVPSTPVQSTPELSADGTNSQQQEFTDMGGAEWASEAVDYLRLQGVIIGENGKFRPYDSITREEFVAILMRALKDKLEISEGAEPFDDMTAGAWYENDIKNARAAGIAAGRDDGTFGIGEKITRADMTVMAYRAFNLINADFTPIRAAQVFDDYSEIPVYALDTVAALQQCGVINGTDGSSFSPLNSTTRAEAAVVIWKLMTLGGAVSDNDAAHEPEKAGTELELLKAIGAQTEISDKSAVTRGDFARMLAAAQGAEVNTKIGQSSFGDVSPVSANAYSIEYVTNMGEMSASADGRFYPDTAVTPEEAVYGLLVMIGYGIVLENNSNVFSLASSSGIVSKAYTGDTITYDDACSLIYNALHSEMVTIDGGNVDNYKKSKDYYALEEYFDIKFDDGICTGNSVTTLIEEQDYLAEGLCTIDNKQYKGLPDDRLLGRAVRYYYKADGDSSAQQLVYVKEDMSKNKSLIVYDDFIDKCADGVFEYYKTAEKTSVSRIRLDKDIDVIYNGAAYPEYDWSDFEIKSGYVELLDNDSDGTYEVAFITELTHMIVGYADGVKLNYYDRDNGSSLRLGDDDSIRYTFTRNGKTGSMDDIRSNVLLSIAKSKSAKVISINESSLTSVGAVTSVEEDCIGIDSVPIPINYELLKEDMEKITLGDTVTLFIVNDRAVRMMKNAAGGSVVGYLTGVYYDEAETDIYFNVAAATNSITRYKGAEKIKIDGISYTDNTEIAQRLKDTAMLSSMYNKDFVYAQPVKLFVNSAGQISGIDTASYDGSKESDDSLRAANQSAVTAKYSLNNKSMYADGKLVATVSSTTQAIWVPRTNKNEARYYANGTSFGDGTSYILETFNVDEKMMPDTMFVYYSIGTAVSGVAKPFIVTSAQTAEEDGEIVQKISYLNGTASGTLTIGEDVSAPVFKPGDAIRYRSDYSKKITVVDRCFSPGRYLDKNERMVTYYKTDTENDFPQSGYKSVYGTVVHRDEGFISVTTSVADDDEGVAAMNNYNNYLISDATVFYRLEKLANGKYDVSFGDYYSLIPYEYDKENPSEVFIYIVDGVVTVVCQIVDEQ